MTLFVRGMVLAVLVGCGGDEGGAAPRDLGPTQHDADALDAGARPDADTTEAAGPDAATPSDAGGVDAESVDMTQPDSGPTTSAWAQVSAGSHATCAVRVDGSAECWGSALVVAELPRDQRFERIATFGDDACGIDVDGWLRCWGDSAWTDEAPDLERHSGRVLDLRCGTGGCCVLVPDGAQCFGSSLAPTSVARTGSVGMSLWGRTSCVWTTDGYAACSFSGGIDERPARGGWSSIAVMSDEYACGVSADTGEVLCPGDPRLVGVLAERIEGNGGNGALCALVRGGGVVCERQPRLVGDVPPVDELRPPTTTTTFQQLSVGAIHACGVTADGRLVCWGSNAYDQLPPSGVL